MSAASTLFPVRRPRTVSNPHPDRIAGRIDGPPSPPPAPAGLAFLRLDSEAPGGLDDLVERAVVVILERLGWANRSTRSGYQPHAARNVRFYLIAKAGGASLAELARSVSPPITRSTAQAAVERGRELVELTRPPSRFNPDRPPARADRRRGSSPPSY